MFYVYAASGLAGLILQVLLLGTMLKARAYRDFPVLFSYLAVLIVTTCIEAEGFLVAHGIAPATSYYYWLADSVRQALLYVLVISLTYRALQGTAHARILRRLLIGGTALYVAGSLLATYHPVPGLWMTRFSRNVGFLSVILNAVLWAALLKYRKPDPSLLLITGGLGIQMAGKAIGHSLRQISRGAIDAGNLILVVSHLVCLYVWWQVFRRRLASCAKESRNSGGELSCL